MSPPTPARPAPTALGPLVARLRLDRGWSQSRLAAELCAAAGVCTLSRHEISRWERGVRVPGRFWRGWLVRILGVPGGAPGPGGSARPARRGRGPAGPRPATNTTRRRTGGSSRRTSTH
ncbi:MULTISPECIES: helix-turn-helix transcriptional regulator [unclassified Micromonospora]|uniref:helix-turn-helix domain-containing protein n=1 Tax=unclassified Micromonospora TaxID=2617518 RepID=UPI0022B6F9E7|nr:MULTISPECIES: helix-turn-helix transcriptional regulator [unclassified Micromonospora]MCZ7418149.1 helix-turn-helix transcriptional regulator [Verrucosispora sp. WMMA2121]WBB91896.1 helix-turn-helix transcriptional regulator [Verrucosispora sp. WMMC514]